MRARRTSGLLAMTLPPTSCRVWRRGGLGRRRCAMTPSVSPAVLDGWMRPFRCHFTTAVWRHVLVLVGGALLAPGRRAGAGAAGRRRGAAGHRPRRGGRLRGLPPRAEPGAVVLAGARAPAPAAAG